MRIDKPYTNAQYADLAVYCNENNCHIEDRGDYLESVENEPHIPTHDEIKQQRIQYRKEHIDDKTLERQRCQANGTWTEEDEKEYLELDAEVTAWIEENLPYPDDENDESGE